MNRMLCAGKDVPTSARDAGTLLDIHITRMSLAEATEEALQAINRKRSKEYLSVPILIRWWSHNTTLVSNLR